MSPFRGCLVRKVLKEAEKICKDFDGRLLDLGCGNGEFLKYLNSYPNLAAIGLDISEKQLNLAKTITLPIVRGDFFSLPFKDNSFSTITCFNTLYNFGSLTELVPVFCEMVRMIPSGGRIVLDLRNRRNPILAIKYWWHMRRGEFPTICHSPEETLQIFKGLGCHSERMEPVGLNISFLSLGYIIVLRKDGS
jgi:ubiquinone/menaquinone biosynthesis C-methylase UbiE